MSEARVRGTLQVWCMGSGARICRTWVDAEVEIPMGLPSASTYVRCTNCGTIHKLHVSHGRKRP